MKYTLLPRNIKMARFQLGWLNPGPFRAQWVRKGWMVFLLAEAVLLWMLTNASTATAAVHENELLDLLSRMKASYAKIIDYTAIFQKQERVENILLPEESIFLKFKKPLHIYMKWIYGPMKEAIYVDGKNRNKVIAHSDGVGLSLTWNLDPKGSILLSGNRHPITDIGFGFILNIMLTNIPVAIEQDEIEITRMEDDPFEGRPAIVLEATFSSKDEHKYYAARMVCHIDKEYLLPVEIVNYDEEDVLFEKYVYKDIRINTGLTEMDFSRMNPDYDF